MAMVGAELDQVARDVRSWVEASEKVPVAANWTVVPVTMAGSAGVTWIEAGVALVTVRVVEPVMPPSAAETVVSPAARAVAWPSLPAAFETAAKDGAELDQVTRAVRSCDV